MNMRAIFRVLLFAALVGAPVAHAEYWYLGGGLGAAKIDDLCSRASDEFCDDTGLGVRGFVGWRVNRGLALELGFDGASGFVTPGARAIGLEGDTSTFSFNANVIGFIPLGKRVSLMGGVSGVYAEASTKVYSRNNAPRDCSYEYDWWDDDWDYYCRSAADDTYDSGGSASLGALAGIEIQATQHLYLRAQAQRFFNVDGGLAFGERRDLDFALVSVLFAFQ